MFSSKPNYEKLKTNLRLAIQRLRLLEKKKTELTQKSRKEIADYISAGKEDRARIRVEHIVREDYLVEALEIIESYCDFLLARFGLIKSMARVDEDLDKPIASVIWSTLRVCGDVPELREIMKQFSHKYGKEYVEMCKHSDCEAVDEKLKHKLSLHQPPKKLLESYMVEIARSYNVPFEPDPAVMMGDDIPTVGQDLIDLGMAGGQDKKYPPPGGPGPGNGGGHFPVATAHQPMGPIAPYPPSQPHVPYPHQDAGYPPSQPSCPPQNQNSAYPPAAASYDPQGGPPSSGTPPPLPCVGPVVHGPSGSESNLPSYSTVMNRHPSPPPAYNGGENSTLPMPPPGPPKVDSTLPDLPSVPLNDLNTPANSFGTSAGGEDVDFDDLTRRFEELKKRK
ncbi:IST1 homolog isoform X2 [Lineus longissimus]|uniref:IST1 homolog isoform X2 n=1 Tax=Lineus longissimus TaxID=88925 RepID=UPI002B4EF0C3